MEKRKPIFAAAVLVLTALLCLSGGLSFAANGAPMTPELAAKREMVRKQQAQRVTHDKRKTAAEALKAERLRVYNAKQAVKPAPSEQTRQKNNN